MGSYTGFWNREACLFLNEVLCANCQGAGLELAGESQAVCRYCGTQSAVDGVVCGRCEFVNPVGAEICGDCRQPLRRKCPNCGTVNWTGAEQCSACQQPLDATTRVGARIAVTTAGRLSTQQSEARALKAQEAEYSQRRRAELEAIEARRQARLAESRQRRDAQQRMMLIGVGLLVAAFVVVVAVALIFTFLAH